jgi:hypothetical protein
MTFLLLPSLPTFLSLFKGTYGSLKIPPLNQLKALGYWILILIKTRIKTNIIKGTWMAFKIPF